MTLYLYDLSYIAIDISVVEGSHLVFSNTVPSLTKNSMPCIKYCQLRITI